MNPADAAPFGIALLGLLLGMRHATDPDHVIAVTTILSRERRLMTAARIGIVWGLGHTLTVLVVGAAIIVFKIAIPTRLGLAMEFAVAIVLIMLGVGAAASLVRKGASRMRGGSSSDEGLIVHAHTHTHDGEMHAHPHESRCSPTCRLGDAQPVPLRERIDPPFLLNQSVVHG